LKTGLYTGVFWGVQTPPNDLSYCYERVTDVCQIFKEIRKNGDDEFKQIFSNSEKSMLEGIIEGQEL